MLSHKDNHQPAQLLNQKPRPSSGFGFRSFSLRNVVKVNRVSPL